MNRWMRVELKDEIKGCYFFALPIQCGIPVKCYISVECAILFDQLCKTELCHVHHEAYTLMKYSFLTVHYCFP